MEKFNATLPKTQKGGKKLTAKRQALFVIYFVGFYLNLTEKCNKKFWKRPFVFGPYKTNFCRYSWLDVYQQLICLKRLHCCNASDWINLL